MIQLRFLLFISVIGLCSSCSTNSEKKNQLPADEDLVSGSQDGKAEGQKDQNKNSPFIGTFVSEGYSEKEKGTDWVSVKISQITEKLFHIDIRSRADIKKPTCTLTSDAQLTEEGELFTSQYELGLGFKISGDILRIYSPSDKELNYFCSGGATLAGKYKRISGEADQKQIDPSQFWKFLEYNNVLFSVQAIRDTLTIQPSLPKGRVEEVKIPFKGSIADADIADLDSDGFPEVYVYVRQSEDQHIRLIAYNLNKGKSLSSIHLQEISNQQVAPFKGGDEFKPVEGVLVRRYPIKGTKKTQQIQYKLKMGEASPQLIIEKVYSF